MLHTEFSPKPQKELRKSKIDGLLLLAQSEEKADVCYFCAANISLPMCCSAKLFPNAMKECFFAKSSDAFFVRFSFVKR